MSSFLDLLKSDVRSLKQQIAQAETIQRRALLWLGLIAKSAITLLFCVMFVLVISAIFGSDTAIVAVVVLLSVLTFQKVHLGYKPSQGAWALLVIFTIFAIAPACAQYVSMGWATLINIVSIFVIVLLGCGRVEFQNHIVLVLSYLLLYGYPVEITRLPIRALVLALGALWSASILYRYNKHVPCTQTIKDILKDFALRHPHDEWKLKLSILVPCSMLIGSYCGLERPMWIGICALSILTPHHELRFKRAFERLIGTLIGAAIFYVLTLIPHIPAAALGIAGGFFVGLSTSYKYQTVFNSLGALSVAMILYGALPTLSLRILDTVFAIIFVSVIIFVGDVLMGYLNKRLH